MGVGGKGYCCPFIATTTGLSRFEPLQCSHSPTLGQTCSHQVDANLLDGANPERFKLQQQKSNKDYYVCETDSYGCQKEVFELEADGNSNEMVWELNSLQPLYGFCNWQIKVKGIDPLSSKLADSELSQYVVTLSIESSKSTFHLVSAT